MCLLPNRRASIDQAPGPIMANVPPITANKAEVPGASALDHTTHPPAMATTVPATGVQRPNSKNAPATAPAACGPIGAHVVAPDKQMTS
jgi:hypothetical protein